MDILRNKHPARAGNNTKTQKPGAKLTDILHKALNSGVVPFYTDLGKNAQEILIKPYVYELITLGLHKKLAHGVDLCGSVAYLENSKSFMGYLASSYVYGGDYAFEAKDRYLKISAEAAANAQTGQFSGELKSAFQDKRLSFILGSKVRENGPIIMDSAIVLNYCGMLVGYRTLFNTDSLKLMKSDVGIQYSNLDSNVHIFFDSEKKIGASICTRLARQLLVAVQSEWSTSDGTSSTTLGLQYNTGKNTSFFARVNNTYELSLAYRQRYRDIVVTLSTMLGLKPDHKNKLGFSVDIEL